MNTITEEKQHKLLEWVGSITGIAGAILLAMNFDWSKYGYVFFLLSSIALVIFSHRRQLKGLLSQQLVFLGINILGVYKWMIA
jgi:nicotinamide riboside transporter PnuC